MGDNLGDTTEFEAMLAELDDVKDMGYNTLQADEKSIRRTKNVN